MRKVGSLGRLVDPTLPYYEKAKVAILFAGLTYCNLKGGLAICVVLMFQEISGSTVETLLTGVAEYKNLKCFRMRCRAILNFFGALQPIIASGMNESAILPNGDGRARFVRRLGGGIIKSQDFPFPDFQRRGLISFP